jgi:hypothetical protein
MPVPVPKARLLAINASPKGHDSELNLITQLEVPHYGDDAVFLTCGIVYFCGTNPKSVWGMRHLAGELAGPGRTIEESV